MSSLETIAFLAATDPEFRGLLAQDPARACEARGIVPTGSEQHAIAAVGAELALDPTGMRLVRDGAEYPNWATIPTSLAGLMQASGEDASLHRFLDGVASALGDALATIGGTMQEDRCWLTESYAPFRAALRPLQSLPYLAAEIAGGRGSRMTAVATAWSLLILAARLQDDLADGDLPAHAPPPPRLTNLGTALHFAAMGALAGLADDGVPALRALAVQRRFAEAGVAICRGQHASYASPSPSLEDGWREIQDKSGAAIALALEGGAIAAGATAPCRASLTGIGLLMGLQIQLSDDFKDFQHGEDLAAGRRPLPVRVAARLCRGTPWALRLDQIEAVASSDPAAARELQALVSRTGAYLYQRLVVAQLDQRLRAEIDHLRAAAGSNPAIEALAAIAACVAPRPYAVLEPAQRSR